MVQENVDYDKVCRTCLSMNNLQSIFVCQNTTKLAKMIMACTSVQVQENDGFPQNICLECVENVKKFYKFKRKCVKINKKLSYGHHFVPNTIKSNFNEHIMKYGWKLNSYKISNENEFHKTLIDDVDSTVETRKFEVEDNNDSEMKEIDNNMDIAVHDVVAEEIEYLDDNNEKIKENDATKITQDELNEEIEYLEDEVTEENENTDIAVDVLNEHEYFDEHGIENGLKFTPENDVTYEKSRFHIIKFESTDFNVHEVKVGTDYLKKNNDKKMRDDESEIEKQNTESTNVSVDKLRGHIVCSEDEDGEETKESLGEIVNSYRMKTCTVCGKKLASRNMKYHMRIHTKEQPFECTKCGLKFSLRGNLTRHLMIHTGERPHKCDICGKGFIQSVSLREHKYKHNFQTLFLCDVCGKGFSTKASFEQHRLGHTHIKSYSCKYCNKTFAYPNSLRVHSLTHTGEKPYSCHVCGNKFAQSTHLTRHLRIHTGSKPYKCNFCGKFFSLKENLTVHIRTHTGETPFECSICGRGFYDSSNMKKHERGHK